MLGIGSFQSRSCVLLFIRLRSADAPAALGINVKQQNQRGNLALRFDSFLFPCRSEGPGLFLRHPARKIRYSWYLRKVNLVIRRRVFLA
jgi:hypothetical protein